MPGREPRRDAPACCSPNHLPRARPQGGGGLESVPDYGMRALTFVCEDDGTAACGGKVVVAFRGTDLTNKSLSGQADACADAILWVRRAGVCRLVRVPQLRGR